MADRLTVERKKMAATTVWVPAASSRSELVHQQYVRRKPDRVVSPQGHFWHNAATTNFKSSFRCLLLCTLQVRQTRVQLADRDQESFSTSSHCWESQIHQASTQQGAGVSSSPSPRLSHFAALGAAFCCRRGSFVAMVREGWHQLRFTGCRGADSKWLMTFWTANRWRWFTADIYIYIYILNSRRGFSLK